MSPILAFRVLATPRLRAAALMRAVSRGGWPSYLWRNILMSLHGCDVSTKFVIPARFNVPHPVGIVIGEGVRIGRDVTIYQNVTLGRDRRGRYPTIEDGVCLMPGVTVVGSVTVGARAIVGACALVTQDVPPGYVVKVASAPAAVAPASPNRSSAWPHVV